MIKISLKITISNPYKCSKCKLCIERCKETHGVSRIKFGQIPSICKQCPDPPCLKVCRTKALTYSENILVVNQDICVGCNLCGEACPYNLIFTANLTAHKCTLCLDADRIIPECILACPDNVLVVKSVDE